jgi:hypothetical protein
VKVHQRRRIHLYNVGVWGDLLGKHVFSDASNKALENETKCRKSNWSLAWFQLYWLVYEYLCL